MFSTSQLHTEGQHISVGESNVDTFDNCRIYTHKGRQHCRLTTDVSICSDNKPSNYRLTGLVYRPTIRSSAF